MLVFISYNNRDRKFVYSLSRALEEYDIEIWLDEHMINVGDNLTYRISSAINLVDFLIIVISPNSINSNWVNYELSLILKRENEEARTRLIPILIQGTNLPHQLSDRMYADFRNSNSQEKHFKLILKTLGVSKNKKANKLIIKSDNRTCPKCNSLEKYEPQYGHRICVNCGYQVILNPPINKDNLCPYCGGYERVGASSGSGICVCCHLQTYPKPNENIIRSFKWPDEDFKKEILNYIEVKYG